MIYEADCCRYHHFLYFFPIISILLQTGQLAFPITSSEEELLFCYCCAFDHRMAAICCFGHTSYVVVTYVKIPLSFCSHLVENDMNYEWNVFRELHMVSELHPQLWMIFWSISGIAMGSHCCSWCNGLTLCLLCESQLLGIYIQMKVGL